MCFIICDQITAKRGRRSRFCAVHPYILERGCGICAPAERMEVTSMRDQIRTREMRVVRATKVTLYSRRFVYTYIYGCNQDYPPLGKYTSFWEGVEFVRYSLGSCDVRFYMIVVFLFALGQLFEFGQEPIVIANLGSNLLQILCITYLKYIY